MRQTEIAGLPALQFENLGKSPGLLHFCTTRAGGVSSSPFGGMNLGLTSTGENVSKVGENWNRVARAAGVPNDRIFSMTQCHWANVAVVDGSTAGNRDSVMIAGNRMNVMPNVDAMVTASPDLCLCAMGADCPGIILYSSDPPAVGIVHSGWRGTCRNIAVAALRAMIFHFMVNPSRVLAGIGPGISSGRYGVGSEVVEAFARMDDGTYGLHRNILDGSRIDLAGIIECQLESAGLTSIERSGLCTWENNDLLYSYRREGPVSGRFCMAGRLIRQSGDGFQKQKVLPGNGLLNP